MTVITGSVTCAVDEPLPPPPLHAARAAPTPSAAADTSRLRVFDLSNIQVSPNSVGAARRREGSGCMPPFMRHTPPPERRARMERPRLDDVLKRGRPIRTGIVRTRWP